MLAKGQRIIFIYFFVIERSDTILIEKSHYFVAFFWSMYIHIAAACQFIKKDWQATGLCTQTPKSAFSTFLFRST